MFGLGCRATGGFADFERGATHKRGILTGGLAGQSDPKGAAKVVYVRAFRGLGLVSRAVESGSLGGERGLLLLELESAAGADRCAVRIAVIVRHCADGAHINSETLVVISSAGACTDDVVPLLNGRV